MALWQKVRNLDSNAFSQIATLYSCNNIPIEVRDFCAVWIEISIRHLSSESFVSGLDSEIQKKLSSILDESGGSIVPFYVIRKVTDFRTVLYSLINDPSNNGSGSVADFHSRFLSCLEAERLIVGRFEVERNQGHVGTSSVSIPADNIDSRRRSSLRKLSTPCSATHLSPQSYGNLPSFGNFPMPDPTRGLIENELDLISKGVMDLEETNNLFNLKCHELMQHQVLRNQQVALTQTNGTTQYHRFAPFQELERKIAEARGEILQMANLVYTKMYDVRIRTSTVLENWRKLKSELDKDILKWTEEQRLAANGKKMLMDIGKLHDSAGYLMDMVWKLRNILQASDKIRQRIVNYMGVNNDRDMNSVPDIPEHLTTVTELLIRLTNDSFVVVHQPCQILRTNTRFHVAPGGFPMEVSLLVAEKLGLNVAPPSVSVSIIDQNTCHAIQQHGLELGKVKISKKGKLLPESVRLDFNPETKLFSAIFRQISLKDFFRTGRKGALGKEQTECVTEEKLCILFCSEFSVGEINFKVWTTSLPVVITTHVSQDCLASAVITWDNGFAQPNRIPFHVTEHANWNSISEVLNGKFESMVGSPLTQEHLKYLASRLSKIPGFPDRISYADLCKADLPEMKFTFWEWFFESAKLIEQHLKTAWNNGYVMGFVDKERAKSLLCNGGCSPGTFLLRFSDTVPGGISIVWLHSDGKAYCLSPFRIKDLIAQPFVEKLDQETLYFVYPDMPKEKAFKAYYDEYKSSSKAKESTCPTSDDYIRLRNQLIIDNPNIPKFSLIDKSTKAVSDNYQIITPHTSFPAKSFQHTSNVPLSQSPHSLIEIDIDEIVNSLTSSECMDSISSPDTTTSHHPSPSESVGATMTMTMINIPRSIESEFMQSINSEDSFLSPDDETFYFEL